MNFHQIRTGHQRPQIRHFLSKLLNPASPTAGAAGWEMSLLKSHLPRLVIVPSNFLLGLAPYHRSHHCLLGLEDQRLSPWPGLENSERPSKVGGSTREGRGTACRDR